VSPQPRRRRAATKDTEAEAGRQTSRRSRARAAKEEAAEDEGDEDEGEGKPTPPKRVARTYEVTADGVEIAEEAGVEVEEGDAATPELINELREAGLKWDGDKNEDGIKYIFGAKSAIPLRKLLHQHQSQNGDAMDPDDLDAIVNAADNEEWGWGRISVATGLSVSEVKKAYVEGGGKFADEVAESGGRIYGKGDSARWHPGAVKGAQFEGDEEDEEGDEEEPKPRRRRAAAKAEPEPEDDEGDDEDDEEPEEKPAPRRRRRARASN